VGIRVRGAKDKSKFKTKTVSEQSFLFCHWNPTPASRNTRIRKVTKDGNCVVMNKSSDGKDYKTVSQRCNQCMHLSQSGGMLLGRTQLRKQTRVVDMHHRELIRALAALGQSFSPAIVQHCQQYCRGWTARPGEAQVI
jgi:hypothetical protein